MKFLVDVEYELYKNAQKLADSVEFEASPQQGDLRLSGPPSGQGAGGGTRTRDRRVPADLRADSLATVPPTPPLALMVGLIDAP
ncbi:hypothetical protein PoB_005477700 [Plakobranchus ocellatus]|uniref:Uncharacterized protein n=1 Tax=Plakobranchus ocellatus TaxID=259542 RepID=A0AAV4C9N5_9GAST|nr:hypothetical protein PoB_005477700 [Plakobranchus ocellatus]